MTNAQDLQPTVLDIVEQITRADLDIEPLTCQSEDYIWRPAKRARVALAAARDEINRLRRAAPKDAWRTMEYADIDTTMWIGVNALDVPDITTLDVDERDCQALIDTIGYQNGEVFTPRCCTLLIHKAEGVEEGQREEGK